jgi:hypothetical protein
MRSREGDPSTKKVKTWMDEVRAETTFGALAQVTAKEYIGKMEGLESITLRLAKLQQIAYDPKTKSSMYLPTQQLHEQFQSVLAEIDGGDPEEGSDIPSIAHMFFDALSHRLKTRVEASIPDQNVTDFETNLRTGTISSKQKWKRKTRKSVLSSTWQDPSNLLNSAENPPIGTEETETRPGHSWQEAKQKTAKTKTNRKITTMKKEKIR